MQRVSRRLDRLDAVFNPPQQPPKLFRVVVSRVSCPGALAKSTCTRTLCKGTLMESVKLNGSNDNLTDEELEEFIQSFPIDEPATRC
jgi:hypothetical protein